MFSEAERRYIETARVGRLATADTEARPHAVPICFAVDDERLVTPIDEKPQRTGPTDLRRSRDIRANASVAVIIDHYSEDWSSLGWVQLRGRARHLYPDEEGHAAGVRALRGKYDQYAEHDLESRPLIEIDIHSVLSWGDLQDRHDDGGMD